MYMIYGTEKEKISDISGLYQSAKILLLLSKCEISKENKSDNFCYRNTGKMTIYKGYQKLFRILVVAIKLSLTVGLL